MQASADFVIIRRKTLKSINELPATLSK